MQRRPLGRTGLQVTGICFGTSGLGNMPETYGYEVDEERARTTIRAIFDGPVNFLDTSNNYGLGRSEERIGTVIRERGGLPEPPLDVCGLARHERLDVRPGCGGVPAQDGHVGEEEQPLGLALRCG